MKGKVAVVCASNPGNLGMYSVDLAAADFMKRHALDYELFTSHAPARFGRYRLLRWGIDIGHKSKKTFGKLSFKRLTDLTQFEGYSHVLYWGDFTPNPVYGIGDFHHVDKRYDMRLTDAQSLYNWERLFNFSGGRIRSRVIAVGNNFQYDYSKDSNTYQKYLKNLGENFDVILPRDQASVNNLKANLTKTNACKVTAGLDPAFLLRDDLEIETNQRKNTFCYFFGRSNLINAHNYIDELEKISGYKGVHLSEWLKVTPATANAIFNEYTSELRCAQFIVTDLYHLAINGIRSNTPVFCIGNNAREQQGTIGDFKKKILFEMLELEKYYIELDPEKMDERSQIRNCIVNNLQSFGKNLSEIYSKKNVLVKDFENKILSAIDLGAP